ncbi:unnamed protein product [Dibothriocephalus latus]|uniref:Uncharacterized protein n=1 Tax=Dibothriocephalus latus TaxID=60516 RepID=A0A3P6PHR5_DIBLA|nr:unnamed protein product [Dibothriocephalus latus]
MARYARELDPPLDPHADYLSRSSALGARFIAANPVVRPFRLMKSGVCPAESSRVSDLHVNLFMGVSSPLQPNASITLQAVLTRRASGRLPTVIPLSMRTASGSCVLAVNVSTL